MYVASGNDLNCGHVNTRRFKSAASKRLNVRYFAAFRNLGPSSYVVPLSYPSSSHKSPCTCNIYFFNSVSVLLNPHFVYGSYKSPCKYIHSFSLICSLISLVPFVLYFIIAVVVVVVVVVLSR